MLISALISELRREAGDIEKTVGATWTADGTTKVLLLPSLTFPVLESSYSLKLGGVTMTETTQYVLDRESGRIDLVSIPSDGDIIEFEGQRVAMTDEAWLAIVSDSIRTMGESFWKEVTDITTYTTTANMRSLDLDPDEGWIDVYGLGRYTSGNVDRINIANWRFSQDESKLYFGAYDEFNASGQAVYIRGIRRYELPTALGDTLDVQDRYLTVLKYGALASYYRYKIRENIESLAKITQETTRTSMQELIMLIDRYERWYEREVQRLKPAKPARFIPTRVPGKPLP
jgi:hypothetical protein